MALDFPGFNSLYVVLLLTESVTVAFYAFLPLFFVKVKNLHLGICYLVCAAHHFNAVHLSHFASLPTILFYNIICSEASGRGHWGTHL